MNTTRVTTQLSVGDPSSDELLLAEERFAEDNLEGASLKSKRGGSFAVSSPNQESKDYEAFTYESQGPGSSKSKELRIAIAEGAVRFTDDFLMRLEKHNIRRSFAGTPSQILSRLRVSPESCDAVVCPIAQPWQPTLNFAREVGRIRDCHGGVPYPRTLIVSFANHMGSTMEWFRRTAGTRYIRFDTEHALGQVLQSLQREICIAQRVSQKLHMRLIHEGNPLGDGCVGGETLVATYASFHLGDEREVKESSSVLRFLNLLAINRWRSRTAEQVIQLMHRSPLYVLQGPDANIISVASVKTYVHRCEEALLRTWGANKDVNAPTLIRREPCGGREIAYRLICSCEVDHI